MNKILKTAGLLTVLSGAMTVNSTTLPNQEHSSTISIAALPKSNSDSSDLWLTLAGLGILGVVGVVSKKINDFRNIPYKQAHDIINDSFHIAFAKKHTKSEKCLVLGENEYKLERLISRTKNYDKVAAEQCKYTLGAIKHSVENDDIPQKELLVKTKYLFDKAVSPKKYFSKLKEQYIIENPDINFNLNYGRVTEARTGYIPQNNSPLLYSGLRSDVMLKELNIILNDIYDESKSIPFYRYDKKNLLEKIRKAKKILNEKKNIPNNLITEINDMYHIKYLKKIIEF